jgi:subtilisin family serine protease
MFKISGFSAVAGAALLAGTVQGAQAQVAPADTGLPTGAYQQWMHPGVPAAWKQGFVGQGVALKVIDQFWGVPGSIGDVGSHGQIVSTIANAIAPAANFTYFSFNNVFDRVSPEQGVLNVFNVSFGITNTGLMPLHQSIVDASRNGKAVVVAAAGNNGNNMTDGGMFGPSLLQMSLIGTKAVIFVGALSRNGDTKPGTLASRAPYSNKAGPESVAARFVMVGVDESRGIPLDGTSAAAPIVSGYAAIIGSKFKTATPTQISNQILRTARIDTIKDYTRSIHGRGEASLSRALSPAAIK